MNNPTQATSHEPTDSDQPQDLSSSGSEPIDQRNPTDQQKPPAFARLLDLDAATATDEQIQDLIDEYIQSKCANNLIKSKYNLLILFDEEALTRFDADRLYDALRGTDRKKPILLVLTTPGGDVSAAYFVAKLCREHTDATFEVAVPRRAKSAGTLICCGADRIHMGSLSELGPIDPQFGAIPALALKHSIEHIAELVGTYPKAKELFSDYLVRSLRIESLGFFERVAMSAAQYAMRLLEARADKANTKNISVEGIANHLVYSYKDHGFVIDSRESLRIFGPNVVVCDTPEYQLSNDLFGALTFMSFVCQRQFSKSLMYIGDSASGSFVIQKRRDR